LIDHGSILARIPAIYPYRYFIPAGPDFIDNLDLWRRSATKVDRIALAGPAPKVRLTTTRPSLDRYRIISRELPSGNDFAAAVAEKLTEANSELWNASVLWELVYNQGSDLRAN
jgi:hypothetical protein